MLDTHARAYINRVFTLSAKTFLKTGLQPIHVTLLSLFFGLAAALFLYMQMFILSLCLLWLSGFFDAVDGEMARISSMTSKKGALLDIFFDRVVEVAYIIAFIDIVSPFALLSLALAIILSITVFLSVGALSTQNSKKSFYYQAGLIERTEGFILFTCMVLFIQYATTIAYIFAFLIFITALQRLLEALRILK